MPITEVKQNKKQYLDLLLLGDEQESMIDRYLERGRMFLLEEAGEAIAVAVVTDEGEGVAEIRNLAVSPARQRCGYGRTMLQLIADLCRGQFHTLQLGTGESDATLLFYEACGFRYFHRVKGFFTEHYDHPIFEGDRQLVDMIYLKKEL